MDKEGNLESTGPVVLMAGNYFDGTGWSRACIEYAMALDSVGVHVICRPIKLNERVAEVPARLLELIDRPVARPDVVIQHVLPHMARYYKGSGGPHNILLFASEDMPISHNWVRYANEADEVWVISDWQKSVAARSGISKPTFVFPHCCEPSRYEGKFAPLPCLEHFRRNDTFLFYTIGEFVERKNLEGLLRAFLSEFSMHERVALVVKGDLPGRSEAESSDWFKNLVKSVKDSLKLSNYPDVARINERYPDEGILRLHATCDCFASASNAEAFCWPAFDAMAMGKTPVVPASSGFLAYANHATAYTVHTSVDISGSADSLRDNHTGKQTWSAVNLVHFRQRMREVFEQPAYHESIRSAGRSHALEFSREKVGLKMKSRINEILEKRVKNGQEKLAVGFIGHPLGEFAR